MIERFLNFLMTMLFFTAGVLFSLIIAEMVFSFANAVDVKGTITFREKQRTDRGFLKEDSFLVTIKTTSGETVVAVTEDRRVMEATLKECIEARLYPYAPWRGQKDEAVYRDALILNVGPCKGRKK